MITCRHRRRRRTLILTRCSSVRHFEYFNQNRAPDKPSLARSLPDYPSPLECSYAQAPLQCRPLPPSLPPKRILRPVRMSGPPPLLHGEPSAMRVKLLSGTERNGRGTHTHAREIALGLGAGPGNSGWFLLSSPLWS